MYFILYLICSPLSLLKERSQNMLSVSGFHDNASVPLIRHLPPTIPYQTKPKQTTPQQPTDQANQWRFAQVEVPWVVHSCVWNVWLGSHGNLLTITGTVLTVTDFPSWLWALTWTPKHFCYSQHYVPLEIRTSFGWIGYHNHVFIVLIAVFYVYLTRPPPPHTHTLAHRQIKHELSFTALLTRCTPTNTRARYIKRHITTHRISDWMLHLLYINLRWNANARLSAK
jgi:hypothetical protein